MPYGARAALDLAACLDELGRPDEAQTVAPSRPSPTSSGSAPRPGSHRSPTSTELSGGDVALATSPPDNSVKMDHMPSVLPEGEPAPADGSLPSWALDALGTRPFGFYVHVPFCTVRCGYCDFNTYTASELGDVRGASRSTYVEAAVAEVRAGAARARRRRRPGADGVLRRRHPDAAAAR